MKRCKYCNQSDEGRLALSSRLVNGKVMHEWVCLDCLFKDMFHTIKEYGKSLPELCEELRTRKTENAIKRVKPVGGFTQSGL